MFGKKVPPPEAAHPNAGVASQGNAPGVYDRGWLRFSQGDDQRAVEVLQEAIRQDPENVEASYALRLASEVCGQGKAAVEGFKMAAISADSPENAIQGRKIHRHTVGHVHRIETEDRNLEKEIWHKQA